VGVGHYENFPVGLFVPKEKRRYVHALYAFARVADDFADEPIYEGVRKQKLDEWEARLHAAYRGEFEGPIFAALSETVRSLKIPEELLRDLLSAFQQDVVKDRYETWDELLDYCRRSADPVGRLVLIVFGYSDPQLLPLSDAICSGLQLANHWQDVALDWRKGRVYLPQDEMARFGVGERHLQEKVCDDAWRNLLAFQTKRTRELMLEGAPLGKSLPGRIGLEIRATVQGGLRILEKIERAGYDVFRRRPKLKALDWPLLLLRAV